MKNPLNEIKQKALLYFLEQAQIHSDRSSDFIAGIVFAKFPEVLIDETKARYLKWAVNTNFIPNVLSLSK